MKILVLHGPNLNLFGRREPHIYGTMTLAEINKRLQALARELKVQLAVLQSNHEGELVDFFHKHMDSAAGAILNPGALTQHGVSLHDCIKAMPFPVLEVHMSNIAAREGANKAANMVFPRPVVVATGLLPPVRSMLSYNRKLAYIAF